MQSRTISGGEKGGGREMVTARLLTNCSNTLRNIHTKRQREYHKDTCQTEGGLLFRGSLCIKKKQ